MKLYFIYDVVSSTVSRTLCFPSDDTCLRFLDSAFKVPNSPFLLNAKDTVLVDVADIDEENLTINSGLSSKIVNDIDICSDYTGVTYHKTFKGRQVLGYQDLLNNIFGIKNSGGDNGKK